MLAPQKKSKFVVSCNIILLFQKKLVILQRKRILLFISFANSFKCGRFAYIKVKEILTKKSIRYELSKQV